MTVVQMNVLNPVPPSRRQLPSGNIAQMVWLIVQMVSPEMKRGGKPAPAAKMGFCRAYRLYTGIGGAVSRRADYSGSDAWFRYDETEKTFTTRIRLNLHSEVL